MQQDAINKLKLKTNSQLNVHNFDQILTTMIDKV